MVSLDEVGRNFGSERLYSRAGTDTDTCVWKRGWVYYTRFWNLKAYEFDRKRSRESDVIYIDGPLLPTKVKTMYRHHACPPMTQRIFPHLHFFYVNSKTETKRTKKKTFTSSKPITRRAETLRRSSYAGNSTKNPSRLSSLQKARLRSAVWERQRSV